jgi:hypothetical protein
MDLGCCWMLFFLLRRVCWPALEECYARFTVLACMDMIEPIGQAWDLDNFSLQKFIKNPILKIKI